MSTVCENIIWGNIEWEKLQHNKNAYEIKGEWFVSVWNKMAKASGTNLMPLHLKDWRKSLKEVEVWMRTTRNLWKRSLGVLKGKSQWWPRPHYSPGHNINNPLINLLDILMGCVTFVNSLGTLLLSSTKIWSSELWFWSI